MEKQLYPTIEISGPETEIRAFVDRELIKIKNCDHTFIKTFVLSKELREILNYQMKIFHEPEIENEIATKIEKQRIDGNFECKSEICLFTGEYSNKYLTLKYINIKVLKIEATEMSFAIDFPGANKLSDVWINYLECEYSLIKFNYSSTVIKEGILRYNSNNISGHGYYIISNEINANLEEGEIDY